MNRPHPTSPPVPLVGQRARHATIGFTLAAALLFWVSSYLYVPTLPTYVQTKTDSLARLVLLSFLMLAAGVGLTATATSLPFLFAAQFFIGLSNGVNFPVLMGLSIRQVRGKRFSPSIKKITRRDETINERKD